MDKTIVATEHDGRINRTIAILIVGITIAALFGMAAAGPGSRLFDLQFNPFALISAVSAVLMLVLLARKPAQTEERIWLTFYIVTVPVFAIGKMMQRLGC